MNTRGFVKLPRSLLEWRWYGDLNTRSLYIHLLMTAAWDDAVYMNREIKRGQCCTTVKELAAINQRTIQQTRTALNHLVSTNDITIEATTQFSIITLTNYDELQPVGKPPDRQITNERQTVQQTCPAETNKPTIIKEKKNIKEDEEETDLLRRLESVVGEYNSICTSLAPVTGELTYQQAQLIRQAEKELHGITFRDYFTRAEGSDFLAGRTGKFRATFAWLIRPENISKVLSGNYDSYSVPAQAPVKKERDYNAPLW